MEDQRGRWRVWLKEKCIEGFGGGRERESVYNMGVQTLYGTGPHPLSWAVPRAERGKVTICGTPNRPNYCVILWCIHTSQM